MYSTTQKSYEKFSREVNTPPPLYKKSTDMVAESSTGTQLYSNNSYAESTDKVEWSTGLCDCFSDCRSCCVTIWCPCVTFGRIAEIVDMGSSSCGVNGALYALIACVTGFPCCYSCFYRSKLRQQYGLKGTHSCDCLLHCFCEYCSLCQEYRELKKHGFDMSIGWHGNVERKNHNMEMASLPPAVERGMTR